MSIYKWLYLYSTTQNYKISQKGVLQDIYRSCLLFTLVCSPEDVEGAGVCVALVDVDDPQVNVESTGPPATR